MKAVEQIKTCLQLAENKLGAVGIEPSVPSLSPAHSAALTSSPRQESPCNAPFLRPNCDQTQTKPNLSTTTERRLYAANLLGLRQPRESRN